MDFDKHPICISKLIAYRFISQIIDRSRSSYQSEFPSTKDFLLGLGLRHKPQMMLSLILQTQQRDNRLNLGKHLQSHLPKHFQVWIHLLLWSVLVSPIFTQLLLPCLICYCYHSSSSLTGVEIFVFFVIDFGNAVI